jgi:hypothetical protein
MSQTRRKSKPKSTLKYTAQLPAQKLANFKNTYKYGFSVVVTLVLIFTAGAVFIKINHRAATKDDYKPPVNETRISTDDTLLKQYIEAYGADEAIKFLKTLPVDCHQRVHKVGRFSYELFGNKAFTVLNSECMSGYTHGVTEAFFHEHGTENLNKNLELICQGQQSGFYAHQCFHGVGHGLMAYNDYDLPVALKSCDNLQGDASKESCYTGVFMENVVGAIAVDEAKISHNTNEFHSSSWLSNDPLFPCNAVEDQYKSACYIFQTSRMIKLPNFDFQAVASTCTKAEASYQSICFLSMGRDVSSGYGSSYAEIEAVCSNYTNNTNYQRNCIAGASQDKFWHESQQDDALKMCKAMQQTSSKQTCYETISARGSEIITSHDSSQAFCTKFEPEYAKLCVVKS